MLRYLSVRHLAVIDQLDVELETGLNVLTGETGAGKSVFVEAIELLVGGRASADLVRSGEASAVVQAILEQPGGREVIVRREISAQGRSRAFIDDALATTAALRDLGAGLIDLHGQHEHQRLLDPVEHLAALDAFAARGDLADRVAAGFETWRAAAAALNRSRLDDREKQVRIDMASFQLREIESVAPLADEDAALVTERMVLANVDRLSRLSSEAYSALYDGEHAAMGALAVVWKRVAELAAIDRRFAPHLDERGEVQSRLDDLARHLGSYVATLDASPDRLQAVEDRLAALDRLKRKCGPSLADVIARQAALRDELAALGASEERIAGLEAEERQARDAFAASAGELSQTRAAAAARLSRALEAALAELAMPAAQVDLQLRTIADPNEWSAQGIDRAEFFLSPNPGEQMRPLARIASGGELSRIMLALRTLTAHDEPPRTLVFDEVDAGIGGAAADAVGSRLRALGARHQVLCITHLPQIAAGAATHFRIAKHVDGGRTVTALERLEDAARVNEIGRMIAGAQVTDRVLASAREMLATRRQPSAGAPENPRSGEQKTKGESERSRAAKAKGSRGA
jgi:DNA repair protein RecN (Recombination protein N)